MVWGNMLMSEVYSVTESSSTISNKESLLTSGIHWLPFLEHSENSTESYNFKVEEDVIDDLVSNGETEPSQD